MKEQIINDLEFRKKCNEFGLEPESLDIQYINNDYIIVLKAFRDDIYILLDKNYNIISMETFYWKEKESIYNRFLQENYESYTKKTINDIIHVPDWFYYPFFRYTLQNIMDINKKVEIIPVNHGHSLKTFVNNKEVEETQENKDYLALLAYLKFLGLRIEDYYKLKYHFLRLKINTINIYEYLKKILLKISDHLDYCIYNNLRPMPSDIIDFLGYNYDDETIMLLYEIINIMLREKGYRLNNDNIEQVRVKRYYQEAINLRSRIRKFDK